MPDNTNAEAWLLPDLHRARRAIVVVDVVESVRLMQEDEAGFIGCWRRFVNEIATQVLPTHGGRLVKSLGDGLLLEFEHVPSAVAAALDIQKRVPSYNASRAASAAMYLRIGVHVADVVVDELDVYGAGVNLAARLAGLAGPGEIVVSADVRDALLSHVDVELDDLGDCFLKHINDSVRAFRISGDARTAVPYAGTHQDKGRPTLLVLPSQESAANPLACVVADDMVTTLGRCELWTVVSRLSSLWMTGRELSLDVLRSAVGATYVLSCSVHQAGQRVRIGLELVDSRSGAVVWSQACRATTEAIFNGACTELNEAVTKVAAKVVATEIARTREMALPNLNAYALLLRGIAQSHSVSAAEFERGHQTLDHLIERHPRSAEPKAWLAKLHILQLAQGWTHDAVATATMARAQVGRALDQQPDHALALAMSAHLAFFLDRDLDRAKLGCEEALRINPNEALAWLFLSAVHAHRGEGPLALQCVTRASATSPMDPMGYYFDGFRAAAALAAHDYAGAGRLAQSSIRANRAHVPSYITHAIACALAGDVPSARESGQLIAKLMPGFSTARYVERYPGGASALARRYGEALLLAQAPP